MKLTDYVIRMTYSQIERNLKFYKLIHPFPQLSSLQNYLGTIHKRGEIDDEILQKFKPQPTNPARAYGLPKIHKCFDSFPPFHPSIDTTGTTYQPVAKYLSKLLSPLALNECYEIVLTPLTEYIKFLDLRKLSTLFSSM